jgi:hypothetical protein
MRRGRGMPDCCSFLSGRLAHFIFYEDLKWQSGEVWAALQLFLGSPAVVAGGLDTLEKRAFNCPSFDYLQDLQGMQAELGAAQDWGGMLLSCLTRAMTSQWMRLKRSLRRAGSILRACSLGKATTARTGYWQRFSRLY